MKKSIITFIGTVLMSCLLHFSGSESAAAEGQALALDGVNDYANAADNASLDLGTVDGQGFTIEAWFYVPDLNGEGLQTLIYKQSAYALYINFHTASADQFLFRLWSPALAAPGFVTLIPTASNLSIGWHHAAAVFDNQTGGQNDTGAVYLDGARVDLGTGLNFSPGIGNSSSPVYIGAYVGTNPFNGWIDEARLSDTVRYNGASYTVPIGSFSSDANTRALWHFNESVGTTSFTDASGNGNTVTGINGAQTATPPDGDTPPPTVQSITRLTPSDQFTSAASVVYRVTFSEHINNVSTADFMLVDMSGTISGESIVSVSASTGTIIDVTANTGTSGNGDLRLDVLAGTATITDDTGNSLNASFTSGQVYTLDRKATATVTLGDLSQTYGGTAKTVSVATEPPGLTVNVTYEGSANAPTNAGSYTVIGNINDPNYQGSATNTLVIGKASTIVTLGNLSQTYEGTEKTVSITTEPAGLPVDVTYNGSTTAPTSVGNYTVIGTINDQNYIGSATNTLVIGKASASVTLGSLSQTYDGTAKSASTTTTPPGLTVNVTYDGSVDAPTNAGSYAVSGIIDDQNYQGGATNTLVVAKATATVTLGNLGQAYDGTAKTVSVTTEPPDLPVEVTYNGSASAPTNAGDYTVAGNINDPNYQAIATNSLVIGKATATVTLGNLAQTYDGNSKTVSVTTEPPGLPVDVTYNGLATAPTNLGDYTVVGNVNDQNYQGSATNTLAIQSAQPKLGISLSSTSVLITWPTSGVSYRLEVTGSLVTPINWVTVTDVPTLIDNRYELLLPKSGQSQFFRLVNP